MNTLAFYKTELTNLLSNFNLKQTEELFKFAHSKSYKNNNSSKRSLTGIWSVVNPAELENELIELRKNLNNDLDNKTL